MTFNALFLTLVSMLEGYLPIFLMIIIAGGLATVLLTVSHLLGHKTYDKIKLSPYECGVNPVGDARERFSVKYYVIAALFVLFDVEILFLFAWAVVYKKLGLIVFIEIIIFFIVILTGYFYMLKRGALKWE